MTVLARGHPISIENMYIKYRIQLIIKQTRGGNTKDIEDIGKDRAIDL